mmetsp:Transcript_34577/g.98355  ORF Transcript_34577/g.98355 Transcript_34577/m.98355 type:complete len:665 (+) Transcript_34577:77-2071(+)
MQLLEDIAISLQDSAALQRLRDNLQDLPRRILSRLDAPRDTTYGRVSGEFNYRFTFKLEGGGGFFQTGVLVAAAESPTGLPVPLRCRWKRRVGEVPVEIMGVTSNMYQISADDIGTEVLVEAQPADFEDGLFGVALGEIGPFELDPSTRRSLDNAVGLGGQRFAVTQIREGTSSSGNRELSINVSTDCVRVANTQGSQGREVVAEYSQEYPRVIIHTFDIVKFQLVMNESRSFCLAAPSRTVRDLIALTIRFFHARKHISMTSVLRQVLPVQTVAAGIAAAAPTLPDPRLERCVVLERLTRELNRAMQQKDSLDRVLRNTCAENRHLQEQLSDSIAGFTEVIGSLEEQVGDAGEAGGAGVGAGVFDRDVAAAHAHAGEDRLGEQVRENEALHAELERCRGQLARSRGAREAAVDDARRATDAAVERVAALRREREGLQARLGELTNASASAQEQHQLEQGHAKELRRLRHDVECLHGEKERLREELQEKDREREELQNNFLYVKGQLDKVQLRQTQAMAVGGPDPSREIRKHRESIDIVGEERSRLSMRLEALLNDAGKEKAYHEQSVERLMTANARLLEEKDRAARDVQRLSQLYADSVQQFQDGATMATAYGSEAAHHGDCTEEDDLRALRLDLATLEEALGRREQENESLKNRIRKLAVAA